MHSQKEGENREAECITGKRGIVVYGSPFNRVVWGGKPVASKFGHSQDSSRLYGNDDRLVGR